MALTTSTKAEAKKRHREGVRKAAQFKRALIAEEKKEDRRVKQFLRELKAEQKAAGKTRSIFRLISW